MPFSIMTSPRYYDVTHFLTDLDENFTEYVKLKIKDILFIEFLIFGMFIEKITINYEIASIVQLPYTSPISPLGRPLGWVLLGTHLSHT